MMTHHRSKSLVNAGLFAALMALTSASVSSLLPPRVVHAAPPGCSVTGEAYGTQATAIPLVASGKTADVLLPPGGTVTSAGVSSPPVLATGAITDTSLDLSTPTQATAVSTATVTNVTILAGVITGNFQSVSTSTSNGVTGTSSPAGSIVNAVIGGVAQTNPSPNTRVDVPGVGYVILDEQASTGAGTTAPALTVNGLHLFVTTVNTLGLPVGAEIIVASATSGVACSGPLAPTATATAAQAATGTAAVAATGTAAAGATQTAVVGATGTAAAGATQTATAATGMAAQTAVVQTAVTAQTAAARAAQTAAAQTLVPGAAGTSQPGAADTMAASATGAAQGVATVTARAAATRVARAVVTPTRAPSPSATGAAGHTAPRITVKPSLASPGGGVTVTGKGFGHREPVTLSLNGVALSSVVTNAQGAFTLTFRAPDSLSCGANSVGAVGVMSGQSAVATLTSRQKTACALYFAGASTQQGEQARLPILNPNGQVAHVTLTFFYRDGAPHTARFAVPAYSRGTANLNTLAGSKRAFGVKLTADQLVSAQLSIARRGQDDVSLLGVSAPSTTWYLAEGYTGLTFHQTLSLLNPGRTRAVVQLRLLTFAGKATRTVAVVVAPQRALLVDVNRLLPGRSLSAIATSRTAIVVARLLTFSTRGYGETGRVGSTTPARSWLFAEGTTTTRFETFLTILNPNTAGTRVTARFYGRTGRLLGQRRIVVPGLRRANIKLNDILHASGVASVVTADRPVVVERPEYFGSPNGRGIAGSDVFGRNGAGLRWAFPDGDTGGRREFLLLYNPSARSVAIDATAYGTNGRMTTRRFDVTPTSRGTIDVNRSFRGVTAQHGFVLRAVNGLGFVAEQTIFAPNFSTLDSTQGVAS